MDTVIYNVKSDKISKGKRIVLLSDLHNEPYDQIIEKTKKAKPDAIMVAGDLVNRHNKTYDRVLSFFEQLSKISKTYFSYGNHEIIFNVLTKEEIEATGAILLDNEYTKYGDEFIIGGQTPYADFDWLTDFEHQKGFKILLCHHPEYYPRYLKYKKVDLILSGHAHGGQMRPFGIALFAPGQGFFPEYTFGYYDEKMIVGRGLAHGGLIPRMFNSTEVVVVDIGQQNQVL
ncbi:MAG: metallophosphoesterase [Oscillospiraceae bacterium]|jgi:predicted MPP superfamily phosphohydrolase|nr:metallophosphoesterase [Oscillospiraceae bacterium]